MRVLRNEKTRRVALMGLLFALSVVLSFLEGTLTPLLGLPPGVKLGLANVVVMYALFFLGTGTFFLLENAPFGLYHIGKSGFSKDFTEPS